MQRFKVTVVLVMVCLLAGSSLAAPTASPDTIRKVVVFQSGVSQNIQNDVIKNAGAEEIKKLPLINAAVVAVNSASEAALLAQPEILRIEDDARVYTQDAGKSVPTAFVQALPWGIERINSNLVWDQDQDGIINNNANAGQGIKVAVLDTGINLSHPDLRDNIYGGYNAIDPRKAPEDTYGHGTHVSGIIAGVNNEIGVIGTAPQANLYAVKVIDINSGYVSDVIEGLQWCIDNGMQVVNMSVGLPEDVTAFHDAIISAYEQGIVLVAAAGNNGPGENTVDFPAKYPEVIAVAATDYNDQIPYWSSQGSEVAIAAPGQDIYSTFFGVTYKSLMGTSMACPHVTGTAALVLASGITDADGNGRVNDEVRDRLVSTATDLGTPGWDSVSGAGLVNAARAVGIQP